MDDSMQLQCGSSKELTSEPPEALSLTRREYVLSARELHGLDKTVSSRSPSPSVVVIGSCCRWSTAVEKHHTSIP